MTAKKFLGNPVVNEEKSYTFAALFINLDKDIGEIEYVLDT